MAISSCDPAALVAAARCFICIPKSFRHEAALYLLCNVTSKATPPCVTPSAPTTTAAKSPPPDQNTQIRIQWAQPANAGSLIMSYTISWGTTMGGPYSSGSATVGVTPKVYTITGLTPGTTYFWVVVANSFAGCSSANSNEGTATTRGSSACAAGIVFATQWNARVVANGGASTSAATQAAIANFQCGLITDGLDTLMLAWNAFVSDNLTAAITPQLLGVASDPWTNHNFIAGDLTVNGLIGNGTTKFLDTGIFTNNAAFWGPNLPNNCGVTAYPVTNTDVAQAMLTGCSNGGGSLLGLELFGGNTFGVMWDGPSLVTAANAGFTGYVSLNRTAINSLSLYEANSGIPHHLLVSSAVANGGGVTNPPNPITVFCYNDNTGDGFFSGDRLGFIAYHFSLTAAQSLLFSGRVQTLMTALSRQI